MCEGLGSTSGAAQGADGRPGETGPDHASLVSTGAGKKQLSVGRREHAGEGPREGPTFTEHSPPARLASGAAWYVIQPSR